MKAMMRTFYGVAFDLFLLLAIASTVAADTPVSGIINSNTTWICSSSPYIVVGNVLVSSGVTLTIEPCVVVKFDPNKALQIDGELIASGTDGNMITFTSNQPTPAAGDWAYIFFSDTSTDATFDIDGNYTGGSILEYCIVEYAGGLSISNNGAVRMDNAHPFINHCFIRDNQASGICAATLSGTLKITNNTVTGNEETGIFFDGGTITVSGNFVSNNKDGGIYAWRSNCLISNNIITDNQTPSHGGGVFNNEYTATISGNIIKGNYAGSSGGGICDYWGDTTISNNIIFDNTGYYGGGIEGGDIVSNNIISDNSATWEGGGIEGHIIINNSIIRNSARNAAAVTEINRYDDYLNYNLITGNNSTGMEPTYTLKLCDNAGGTFNYNNLFDNTATYELWNDNAAGSPDVNAENNWWGTATESEIQTKIYDWFDDATKSIVDYSPWDTAIRTDAPISPPTGLVVSTTFTEIIISWDANPEGDLAGYKVYWGTQAVPFFENVVDVGNSLSHIITGLAPGRYYVAVTAYDNNYNPADDDPDTIVNESQTNGNESWYTSGTATTGVVDVSGRVTDKETSAPLADITVGCWHEDADSWTETLTDVNGEYELTDLSLGEVHITAMPESTYAWIGTEIELTEDINNLDFALPLEARLSGKVIDATTAEPVEGVEVTYWSERHAVWQNVFTSASGTFALTNLPPGVAEIKARPHVDTGYAWTLPEGSDWIHLDEGQHESNRIIALRKGAVVTGYIKDPNGVSLSNIEYDWQGKMCDGWSSADANGYYEIRLPLGDYLIQSDDEDVGALPVEVTITDVNQPVNVPDIIAYPEGTGGQISGSVSNPGSYNKTGLFVVVVFEAGTIIDPNSWYTTEPVRETELEEAGPFSISQLPPDANYDIHLCVASETPDEIMSLAIRDSEFNVSTGVNDVNLIYSSEGSTVSGSVINSAGRSVLGAAVLLNDPCTNALAGFGETDPNGDYVTYNVAAGTYTATAVHSKYLNASAIIEVVDGVPASADTIVMSFGGEKEGADLNGNGHVDIIDVADFVEQWLQSGACNADFNEDNNVNFVDWTRLAENWLWQAMWYND